LKQPAREPKAVPDDVAPRGPTLGWRRAALIAVVAAAAYAPILRHGDTYDDEMVMLSRADLREAHLATLFDRGYFGRYREDTYRPMVTASYMVDHNVSRDLDGARRAGHLQNIAWHAATSVMVAALAVRILPAASGVGAIAAGVFFAIHPAATEAAVSIGFREDVMAACFSLASLCLALSRRRGRLAGALLLFALGLLSKENAVVVPALLFLLRCTLRPADPPRARALVKEMAGYALVTAGFLYVRFGAMASPDAYTDPLGGTYAATVVAVPRIFAHYLRLLVVPWPLCAQYAHMFPLGASFVSQLPWLLLDLAVLVGLLRLLRRRADLGYGLIWFCVALSPMLNLIPIRFAAADRFMYLPLAGGALTAGGLVAAGYEASGPAARSGARVTLWSACGLSALVLLTLTELRIPAWRDDLALWTDTLRRNPRAYTAHYFMYQHFLGSHDKRRARMALESAVATCPRQNNFGRVRHCSYYAAVLGFERVESGQLVAARDAFNLALDFDSQSVPALTGLGHVALREGDLARARRYEAMGTMLNPLVPQVRALLDGLGEAIRQVEQQRP
jgi:hypothetical protein